MNDDDSRPMTTSSALSLKKEASDSSFFGRGWYKFWALVAILLLPYWSMFIGTVSLWRSTRNLDLTYDNLDILIDDDIDVLEMEDREGMVKHMWNAYTSSHQIRLVQFWREAFEAAFEDMTNEFPGIREATIYEIVKMSLCSITVHWPPIQTTVTKAIHLGKK